MIEEPKGDPRIVVELARALRRNRAGTNPNQRRGRMYFDFKAGKVAIAAVTP